MDIHKNVRLTVHGRERIVELLQGGQSVAAHVLDQSDGLDHHHAENAIDDESGDILCLDRRLADGCARDRTATLQIGLSSRPHITPNEAKRPALKTRVDVPTSPCRGNRLRASAVHRHGGLRRHADAGTHQGRNRTSPDLAGAEHRGGIAEGVVVVRRREPLK